MTNESENTTEADLLESLFALDSIADNGFSERVESLIRRRLWLRRVVLATAFTVGLSISLKPTLALLSFAMSALSGGLQFLANIEPQIGVLAGIVLLAAMTLITHLLEE